ncbi:MAG: N-acetylmuramoyl-L-alanine amidase [Acidobacteriota bacterium]
MNASRLVAACVVAVLLVVGGPASLAQAPRPGAPYALLTAESRRTLSAVQSGGRDLLRLDELSDLFELTVREDRRSNALTVTRRDRTIVLSLDQGLASIGGRLVSLPVPPVRDGNRWLVPVDFVARALALIVETRIEVRRASRLIVVGELNVPQVVVRQEQLGAVTRLAFDVSPRAAYTVTQEAGRLLVRFDADAVDASMESAVGGGLAESVRAADANTLAVGLAPHFGTYRASTLPLDAGSIRVVLDLAPAGAPVPSPSDTRPAQPPAVAPEPPVFVSPGAPAVRTIVIDPGHGGDESGATGPGGLLEKNVTLDVARRLRSLIEGRLGLRVLLTRDDDRLVPLDERASIANNNKADVFISVHANVSPRPDSRGAEVFYLSLDAYEGEARRLAEHPPSRSLMTLGGGTREIGLIPWEMAQVRHLPESAVFAQFVEEELRRRVEMSARALQQAPLRVLVGANMPAVLVEMAFISNADQEERLRADDFKTAVTQALYDAVLRYRARIQSGPTPSADPGARGGAALRRTPWP